MSVLPVICIDQIPAESENINFELPEANTENLTVPKSDFLDDSEEHDEVIKNIAHPESFIGQLWITTNHIDDTKNLAKRELIWVQYYQKTSSMHSKLNSPNIDIPKYVMFYKSRFLPNNPKQPIPDMCSQPLLCLNLKHTRATPVSEKKFIIYTRAGEGYTIKAEIADQQSVQFWLGVFNESNNLFKHFIDSNILNCSIETHSAPNSPKHVRRGQFLSMSNSKFSLSSHNLTTLEPLNNIQELENEI